MLLKILEERMIKAIERIENIFDDYDEIMYSFSGGKDSTLSANLLIREWKIRNERVRLGSTDPLDLKWFNKKLWGNTMHCEWMYSSVLEYINKFCKNNTENTNFFYKCFPIGWSSAVTFGNDRLISWDKNFESQWIQKMPNKNVCGCEVVNEDNISNERNILLKDLKELNHELYSKWKENISISDEDITDNIDCDNILIPNYGLGNRNLSEEYNVWFFNGQGEDHEQETFSKWFLSRFPENTKICNRTYPFAGY